MANYKFSAVLAAQKQLLASLPQPDEIGADEAIRRMRAGKWVSISNQTRTITILGQIDDGEFKTQMPGGEWVKNNTTLQEFLDCRFKEVDQCA